MVDRARVEGGRFGPGNQFSKGVRHGKGNRRSSRMWSQMVREALTEEAWAGIIARAIEEATGDVEGVNSKSAREWLSKFVAAAKDSVGLS